MFADRTDGEIFLGFRENVTPSPMTCSSLSKLMADAITPPRKPPLDVEMGTPNPAGAAFQAAFVGYADAVIFSPVHVGRTDVETGLVRTFIHA